MSSTVPPTNLVVSFLALRRLIGVLGIALPLAILLYVRFSHIQELEASISAYYHTTFRDILVGTLCSVGVFMIAYKGHDNTDTLYSTLAGMFAIGVAMFPTSDLVVYGTNVPPTSPLVGIIHIAASGGLFFTFSLMSFFRFTRTAEGGTMSKQKVKRNRLYRICAIVIWCCIGTMIAHQIFFGYGPYGWRATFWLEATSLFAFGLSWLVKGETIMKD